MGGDPGLDSVRVWVVQRRDNPYTPGASRKPPYLAGRDRDLEEFASRIEVLASGGADRSRIYDGLRWGGEGRAAHGVGSTPDGWCKTATAPVVLIS